MGRQYKQLTIFDRKILEVMLVQGLAKSLIAKHLHVHVSTIYREIKRNIHLNKLTGHKTYRAWRAQKKYIKRRYREEKLIRYPKLRALAVQKLERGWSPWQIEWHIKQLKFTDPTVTHESIYRFVYKHWKRRCAYFKHFRRQLRFKF